MLEAFRLHPLEELAQRLKTEQQVLGFELEVPGPSPHFLQVNAAAILDDDNNRLGALLIFHDLTRLKQLESTRQEFVANVSHELRTPLSMIKGYAETLLNGAKNDPEVATRFLQIIERHADRLAFLIDDLLTISQLEGGEMVLNLDAVNLHGLVAAVFEDLRARAEKQHVLLHNSVPDGLRANADGERLKQVLWNLVENAIKYGGEDGQVRVSAETVNSDTLQVSVRDNGPGIPEEALLRVFERFYRVDKARSREAGGTGLGLSIVKHIVQRHGGKVWAESVLSEGSTFYFTLPSAPML
jgi:two-component system phosphate regulon sensor histidine kinase PhoR